jgi:hypothetical protein
MKTVLIAFAVLLAILTLISAFGGSLNREGFEDESFPLIQDEDTQHSTENFWEEQQKALVEQFAEDHEQKAVEPFEDTIQQEAMMHTAEHAQEPMMHTTEHAQENFAGCGNYKEDFVNLDDIEPYEDEKATYGAY